MQYVTCQGVDFRGISKMMTDRGIEMNHATARNILLSALRKMAYQILPLYNTPTTPENLDAMVKSQEYQDGISDLLYQVYQEKIQNYAQERKE